MIARPDIESFQVLPWRDDAAVARMFTSIQLPDGTPFDGDSREILRRTVQAAQDRGLHPQIGTEVEFYLLKELPADGPPEPLAAGGYYDLTPHDISIDFRRSSIGFLEQLGVPVRASYHEAGPSQQEVVIAHADPISSADAVLTTRMAMKQAAYNHGCYASFMPKPLAGQPGSALHMHVSLFGARDENLFHDPADPQAPLSATGRAFLAGVLRHAPEFTAVTSQWVNSYTRLADGHEAPNHVTWSQRFANPLVRVPEHRPDAAEAKRIEFRLPDAGSNPYLVFALVLAAGLRGIDEGYELGPESHDDRDALGAERLPQTLREAVELMHGSAFVRATLGDRIVDWLVANKRRDIDAYARRSPTSNSGSRWRSCEARVGDRSAGRPPGGRRPGLAQLGYQPRFVAPRELPEVASAAGNGNGGGELPALLVLVDDVERCAELLAAADRLAELPAVVVADAYRLGTGGYAGVGHELIVHPFHEVEFEVRVARACRAVAAPEHDEVIRTGTLELNTATYQVTVDGLPIDFTYMEYELLKFLVTNPDRVFSRDALLSNVWATTITAAPAPSTCTSVACGPSSARSTRPGSAPCAALGTAGTAAPHEHGGCPRWHRSLARWPATAQPRHAGRQTARISTQSRNISSPKRNVRVTDQTRWLPNLQGVV